MIYVEIYSILKAFLLKCKFQDMRIFCELQTKKIKEQLILAEFYGEYTFAC